jgi:hypothetical protein
MTTTAQSLATPIIAIRQATADDHADLRRLAALDSAAVPSGDVLLGVVDGDVRAAVEIAAGRVIANPFVATAEIVALLEIRAARLRGDVEPERAGPRVAAIAARRLRRTTALRT